MSEIMQNHAVVQALGWMLLHSLWQAALIGLLIRASWWFVSRRFARLRYGLALTGLALILISSLLTYSSHYFRWERIPPATGRLEKMPASGSKSPNTVHEKAWTEPPAIYTTGSPEIPQNAFSLENFFPYLVLLWVSGAFFLGIRLLGSYWYMRRVGREGLIGLPDQWEERFAVMRQSMRLKRNVCIYFSSKVKDPVTLGHLKPIVLFPIGLVNQLSVDQVEAIILHELAHIRRWDYLMNWVQSIVELLFFYHPAVWWLSGEVRKAREDCCDDLVLRSGGTSRQVYAQTLTHLAALSFKPKTKLVMSITGIKDAFSQRILRLYGQDQTVIDWRKPVLSIALGCLLLPCLFLIKPEIIAGDANGKVKETLALSDSEYREMLFLQPDLFQSSRSKDDSRVHPQLPEQLFIVDGQMIDPAADYRETANDDLENVQFLMPEEAMAKYGEKGRYGVSILRSKSGKWEGGKPYSPLYKLLGGNPTTREIPTFSTTETFFINGKQVNKSVFNNYNVYSFHHGTIMHPKVGAIHGLDGTRADLSAIRKEVGENGIAYELRPGLVVVEYLERCRNTIEIAAVCSPLTYKVPGEKNRLQEAISWREREFDCRTVPSTGQSVRETETTQPSRAEALAAFQVYRKVESSLRIFPSPFTRETKIAFTLPRPTDTKVIILNTDKKRVAQLTDEFLETGPHEFTWNATEHPNGYYWVRIELGKAFFLVKPLIKQ